VADTYKAWWLPAGDAHDTRRLVDLVARIYGHAPRMRQFVAQVVIAPKGVAPRDDLGIARAVFEWVRDNIRFLNEAGESVLTPGRVLKMRYGDCDDRSGLVGAMLTSVRIPYRLRLLARRKGEAPNERLVPFHIWPQAIVRGRPVDLETCHPRALFGEHPAALMARMRGLRL
jgi:transglutaminase-like putative cysteine protease